MEAITKNEITRMYELSSTKCKKSRDFAMSLNSSVVSLEKAKAVNSCIQGCMDGTITPATLHSYLEAAFMQISFKNNKQRMYQLADSERRILRYVRYTATNIWPYIVPCGPKLVQLAETVKPILVNPNYVTLTETGTLTIIKYKESAPISQKAGTQDLGLYTMILYGRILRNEAPENIKSKIRVIKAEYHFLRKNNDRSAVSKDGYNFDYDFLSYNENGDMQGGNIVGITEQVEESPGTDFDFEDAINEYVNGLDEKECSDTQCNECSYKALCKFAAAPLVIKTEKKATSICDISLSVEQEKAVNYEKGILRILAGAGAGKTLVVALRVVVLLQKGYRPEEILLTTFSNAGAEEMRTRIAVYLKDFGMDNIDPQNIYCTTFNSLGNDIINMEYARFGFTEVPAVIDDVDRSRIISDLLNTYNIPGLNYRDFLSDMVQCLGALELTKQVFDIIKRDNLVKGDVDKLYKALGRKASFLNVTKDQDGNTPDPNVVLEALFDLYDIYNTKLVSENLIEFADQEVLVQRVLDEDPYYLERFGFRHIIVDEFQDTSMKQMDLIKRFRACRSFLSLMVVGDDAQAIYSFRDTSPEYIINFPEIMGEHVDDIPLLENHRSSPEIIDFANKINARREEKVDKDLIATRPSVGIPVTVQGFLTKDEEIDYVVKGAKEHYLKGLTTAIITATNNELQQIAGLLTKEGIPSIMLNPEKYVDNGRIQAVIALANLMRNYGDTHSAAIYGNAKMGGGIMSLNINQVEMLVDVAKKDAMSLNAIGNPVAKKQAFFIACRALDPNEDEVFENFLKTLEHKSTLQEVFRYIDDFYIYGSDVGVRRTHDYPGVVLCTAHSSKGLEWPVVYNMITKYNGSRTTKPNSKDIEEKKRLLFVSATRARDELYVTGQYIISGNKQDGYNINPFLVDAYECVGKEIDRSTVIIEKEMRAEENKLKKKLAALDHAILRKQILSQSGDTDYETIKEKMIEDSNKAKKKIEESSVA